MGCLASVEALSRFDTDGAPVVTGSLKWTFKGQVSQKYQTPWGAVELGRHVYQTSRGGATLCPLEERARIIRKATPRFAMQVSHKYAGQHARAVARDLTLNHNRPVAPSFVQNLADAVGSIAQAKEESWGYEVPPLDGPVASVVLSMDGAMIPTRDSGWREAMVGTISLYADSGERLHTVYLGTAPEYGKAAFRERMEREIARVKARWPGALYLGIADGVRDNWSFLEQDTDRQLLDFFHVTEYLARVAHAAHPEKTGKPARRQWLTDRCEDLKHVPGTLARLVTEMERLSQRRKLTRQARDDVRSALTYFGNNLGKMDYPTQVANHLPIGSGVTEAACKTLVKQRLCGSGMR